MPSDAAQAPVPDVAEVRPGIWAVPIRMPAQPPYILCYLIEDAHGSLHAIDPGWDSDEGRLALTKQLADVGKSVEDIASIVVTHLHRDHLGAAGWLSEVSGAPVWMHRAEAAGVEWLDADPGTIPVERLDAWGVPADRRAELVEAADQHRQSGLRHADRVLDDGDELSIPGRRILAVWTPGHTSGHLCLRSPDEGLLFSGDHVLPTIFSGIGIGAPSERNPIADYLGSLERVAAFEEDEVLPGHEFRFTGIAARTREIADHHLARSREVQRILGDDPDRPVWEVARQLTWTLGWSGLQSFTLLSALTQTELHAAFVRSEAAARYL